MEGGVSIEHCSVNRISPSLFSFISMKKGDGRHASLDSSDSDRNPNPNANTNWKAWFCLDRETAGQNAAILGHIVRILGHRHSVLGQYEGGDILMLLHYMESTQKEPISPSFVSDVLENSMKESRLLELTKWMQATGKCKDKFGEIDEEEICLQEHRMRRFKDGTEQDIIIVLTNRAIHEFQENRLVNKGTLTHLGPIFYEQTCCLSRNHSGQAVHLEIYLDSGKILKQSMVYLSPEHGEVDAMMKFIMARAPKHGRTRATLWLEDLHLTYLLKHSETLEPEEAIDFSFYFEDCVLEGRAYKKVCFLMSLSFLSVRSKPEPH